jgi:adenylate cyclase
MLAKGNTAIDGLSGSGSAALQAAEMRRSAARPTTDLTAYDLYLRALAIFFPVSKQSALRALSLLEQAIAIDSHYGRALSWAAVCHRVLAINRWVEPPDASRRKARDLAREALQVTENDPGVLGNAAIVLGQFGEDIGVPMALVDRALALNPSDAAAGTPAASSGSGRANRISRLSMSRPPCA